MDWGFSFHRSRISWIGPSNPDKNLYRAVWEPAHRFTADILGLEYVDAEIDCVGRMPGEYDWICDWEIKTRHKHGDFLLRRDQHFEVEARLGGYILVTLNRSGYDWHIDEIKLATARGVDEELGIWCEGPRSRDYWVQWFDPSELQGSDYTEGRWSHA